MKTTNVTEKAFVGNPHARLDEGEVASAMPRRGSLLYVMRMVAFGVSVAAAWTACACQGTVLSVVQDVDGYNSWPMIQVVEGRLVCAYGRGKGHYVEGSRGAYARWDSRGESSISRQHTGSRLIGAYSVEIIPRMTTTRT